MLLMTQNYVTYQQVETWVTQYYQKHGRRTDFVTAVRTLLKEKPFSSLNDRLCLPLPNRKEWQTLSQEDFFDVLLRLPVNTPFWDNPSENFNSIGSTGIWNRANGTIFAESIMPSELEVYALRYVRDIVQRLHIHNFFEVNYVLSGSCQMVFEQETLSLQEGNLCIIAPNSRHDVTVSDESQVISLMLRQNTFDLTFFHLMAQDDLLASFLRNILYSSDASAGYLLFSTDNSDELFYAIRDIFMECHLADRYSNTCVISRVHLLFGLLLRDYGTTIRFYEEQKNLGRHGNDHNFPALLQYIQNHYQTVTLDSLAAAFHYNPSYLSRLIKKQTGKTLTEILTHFKLSRASYLLLHTSLKISDIAEFIGYDNVDHFSRQFRKQFGVSPKNYRAKNKENET